MDKEFLVRLAMSDPRELTAEEVQRKALMDRSQVQRPLVMVDCSTPGRIAGQYF